MIIPSITILILLLHFHVVFRLKKDLENIWIKFETDFKQYKDEKVYLELIDGTSVELNNNKLLIENFERIEFKKASITKEI